MWEHFQIRMKWAANNCNSAGSSVETRLPIITHGGNCALTNRSGNQKPKYRSHMKYETNCSNFPKGAKAHMWLSSKPREREILASRSRPQSCRNRVLWFQRFIADECVFNFKSSLKWFIHLILFFSPSRLAEMWNHLQGPASCSLGRPYFTMFSLYRAHFFIVHIYDYDIVKNYALIWLWWCKVCMCAGHKFASDSWVKA